MKKIFRNKLAKGLVSLIAIIVLLSSILATSIFYNNNITANVVKETSINDNKISIQIKIVDDIKELSFLNEGWYQIVNGYVFYLEHFDSFVPLYIKVKNMEQQNGILGIEEDGNVIFYNDVGFGETRIVDEEKEEIVESQITGEVSGFEEVSGFAGHTPLDRFLNFMRRTSEEPKKQQKLQEQREQARRAIEAEQNIKTRIEIDRLGFDPIFEYREKEQQWFYREPDWLTDFKPIGNDMNDVLNIIKQYSSEMRGVKITKKDGVRTSDVFKPDDLLNLERRLQGLPIESAQAQPLPLPQAPPPTQPLIIHKGVEGTSIDEKTPVNVFTPGQPFYFDQGKAKDLGNGIYQIQTPDGKPAIYDTAGTSGPTVYVQDPDTGDVSQVNRYILNSQRYLTSGTPQAGAPITELHSNLVKAWRTATASSPPTIAPRYEILPPTTKFSELKVGDIIDGQEITRINEEFGGLTIYTKPSTGSEYIKAGGAAPNQEIRNWMWGIGLGEVIRPSEPGNYPTKSQVYEFDKAGKFAEAETTMRQLYQLEPTPEHKLWLSAALGRNKKYDEALKLVDESIKQNPNDKSAYQLGYGIVAAKNEEDYQSQLKYAKKWVELDNDNPSANNAYAWALANVATDAKQKEEAVQYALKAVRLATEQGKSPSEFTSLTHTLGRAYEKAGNLESAQHFYQKAYDDDPQKASAEIKVDYYRTQIVSPEEGISYEVKPREKNQAGDEIITYSDNSKIIKKASGDTEIYDTSGKLVITVKGETTQPRFEDFTVDESQRKAQLPPAPAAPTVTPSFTPQQKETIAQLVNQYVEAEARESGRKLPNEQDFNKGKEEYLKSIASTSTADHRNQINKFIIEEYLVYKREPGFVEKPTPTPAPLEIRSGITYEDGKYHIETEDGGKVEATPDDAGGFTYVGLDKQKYYVDDANNFYKVNDAGKFIEYLGILPPLTVERPAASAPSLLGLPLGTKIGYQAIITPLKPGVIGTPSAPGAVGVPSRPAQPNLVEGHPIDLGDGKYQFVGVYKDAQTGLNYVRVDGIKPNLDKDQKTILNFEITAEGKPQLLHPSQIQGANTRQWDGNPSAIPLVGGGWRNAKCEGNSCTSEDRVITVNPQTKIETITKERIATINIGPTTDKGDITETVTTYDPKDGKIKSSIQTYSDKITGTKREITAKEGQAVVDSEGRLIYDNIKSITFEKEGRKLEVNPNAYNQIRSLSPSDEKVTTLFFEEARNRGITKIDKIEESGGFRYVGDLKGVHVGFVDDGRIISKEGENVVGYIDRSKGLSATIEGKALPDIEKGYVLLEGATAFVKVINHKGETESDRIEQRTKQGLVVGEYKDKDKIELTISEDGTIKSRYTLSTEKISDATSPFNGMYRLVGPDGKTYYIDSGETGFGLPFGLGSFFGIGGGTIYQDIGGKPQKVEDVQRKAELEAVKLNLDKERERKGVPTPEQLSSQRFFAEVDRLLTEFSGLGYYATLFFDEDDLLRWRDAVDRAFATLYLGTEYWSSAICAQYLDGEDEGIAWAETPQGLAQVAAHIEATRTEPIQTPTGTEFIYKITFNVRNGDYDKDPRAPEEMNINVALRGERTVLVFKQEQKVKRGSSFGRTGRNAIAKASKYFYNEVCLTFDNVPYRWKISNSGICNTIVESSGAPTAVGTSTTATTSGGGGTIEGDLNDF